MKRGYDGDRAGGGGSDVHPWPEDVLRSVEGGADPWLAEQLRVHLGGCATCRELAHDLENYPDVEPPNEAFRVDEQEARRALGAVRRRLLLAEASAVEQPDLPTPSARRRLEARGRWRRSARVRRLAAAAALAAALIGGAFWWLYMARLVPVQERLQRAEHELFRPLANVPIAQLLPSDDPLRSPELPGIAADAGALVLLETEEALPSGELAAEIRTIAGTLVLRIDGLVARPAGVTFYLPPGRLPPGDYRVRLLRGSGEMLPVSYDLAILAPSQGS